MKSNSYLIFAMIFLFSMLNQILVSIDSEIFLFDVLISLSFVLFHLLIIQLASELVNHKLPISAKIWKTYGVLTFLVLVVIKFLIFSNTISEDYSTLKFLIGNPLRILAGVTIIYGTLRSNLIVKSPRTSFIRNWWILVGLILALTGIIEIGIYSIDIFYDVGLDRRNSLISVSVAEVVSYTRETSLTLVVSVLAIFFPEAMLLSHTQVLKSAKLYELISETHELENEFSSKSFFRLETSDVLIEYIKSLPDDIVDSLDKTKSK